MHLSLFLLGFVLPGTLCASWTWLTISFPMFGMFSAIISSNIFSGPFSCYSPSGTPIMQMLVHLMFFQRSLRLSSFLLFFLLYPVLQQWFLPFCPPGHLSVLLPQLFGYWSPLIYYSSLFLCSSKSLVTFITSFQPLPLFFFQDPGSSSLSLFWTLFLEGYLSISTSFSCFTGVLSCSFIWDVTFWFFMLINFLKCHFCFSHCGTVVFLASSVCPLMEEANRLL